MSVIAWGSAARVALDGPPREQVERAAGRWCSELDDELGGELRLVVPASVGSFEAPEPKRVRVGIGHQGAGASLEVKIGPHAVVLGAESEPDVVRFSRRRPPSPTELDLLVDVGVNHLLARQGLPVLHSCSFELGGVSVLGLGEGFSGKSTVAAAALSAGGRVVSDDVALVVPEGDRLHSLLPVRSYGWFRGRTSEIVPDELRARLWENEENGQPRWTLYREDAGERFVGRSTPEAIWIQSIDRRLKTSRVEPVDHGQVFAALIRASSPLYLSRHCPEIRDRLIPLYRSLCEQCRGYRVRLAPRLLEEPVEEIERLVDLSRLRDSDPNYEL